MERIPLDKSNTVLVRAAGDVCIRGWDQEDMQAFCDRGRLVYTQQDNGVVYVVSKNDLCLSLPAGMPVRLEHVSGDAYIVGLGGRLEIQKVGGDLAIERCAQVDLSVTGGDLMLREVTGPVAVQKVGGDLNSTLLAGGLIVEQVGGSASFQAGDGALRVRVGGDLKLFLPGKGSEEVALKAGGDIEIFVDDQADARFELSCGGRDVEIDVKDREEHFEDETVNTVLGAGARVVRARAGGDIRVCDEVWDEDDLVEDFEDLAGEWDDWLNDRTEEESEDIFEIEERVRRRAEDAARRAEQRVREAMERVERQNRRRQDVFSRFGIRWGNFWKDAPKPPVVDIPPVDVKIPPININIPPIPEVNFSGFPFGQSGGKPPVETTPTPPDEPAVEMQSGGTSNEERMQVLKMLREHKITVEEAEDLLRTLNGDEE